MKYCFPQLLPICLVEAILTTSNYANGKRNVLFPRNVCYHCNPVWGLILQ
jgi:hypothetical protein